MFFNAKFTLHFKTNIMKFNITIQSNNLEFSRQQAFLLKKWLQDEENYNFYIEQKKEDFDEDDAGGGNLLEMLTIILGTPSIIIFAKSINTWILQKANIEEAKKRNLKLEIERSDGCKILFEVNNAKKDDEAIIEKILDFSSANQK